MRQLTDAELIRRALNAAPSFGSGTGPISQLLRDLALRLYARTDITKVPREVHEHVSTVQQQREHARRLSGQTV